MTTFTLLGVPIDSVGRSGGTEHAPAAFRALTRADDPWATDVGDRDVRIRGDVRDPASGVIAIDDVLATTRRIADTVADLTAKGSPVLVMGGCCALVPGALAGARRTFGRVGLAYLDGHLDLYDGETSPTGEAADMPISVVLGRGPEVWVEAVGGTSEPADVTLLGPRDLAEALTYGHPHPDEIPGVGRPRVVRAGQRAERRGGALRTAGSTHRVDGDAEQGERRHRRISRGAGGPSPCDTAR